MLTKRLSYSSLQGTAIGTALLLLAPAASAQEVDDGEAPRGLAPGLKLSVRFEPGLAMAVTEPQADRTELGFGQTVKVMFGLNRYLAIGPTFNFTSLPAATPMSDAGTSWAAGGGARLARPHDAAPEGGRLRALSPWADLDLLYVRTGDLDRPGLAAAVGVAMPLDDRRRFWLGPHLRYSHIFQGERAGFDNRDAKVLAIGLGLEVGTGREPRRARVSEWVATPPPDEPVVQAPADRDGDGVADADDLCPDVVGVAAQAGCPVYAAVVVQPDKLELRQHIVFRWDSAVLDDPSFPLLEEVARALADNRAAQVQIEGHASSDGADPRNQELSLQRAEAVRDYLVSRGVAADRLIVRGFSSSSPSEGNETRGGREANRRVEFVVSFIVVEKGNTP